VSEKWGQKDNAAGPLKMVWTGVEILFPPRRRVAPGALPMPMLTMGLYHLHRDCQRESEEKCRFLQSPYH
jgi:hypothetical protein